MSLRLASAVVVAALAVSPPSRLAAQVGGPLQPPTTGGLPVLLQELRMLGHNKRVLMIGAHPDDEDTQLLVMFTRREGAEAAYLSLTRGEGGQNLIGNELGEALGILRTEELLAARNVDGAQQFFTRAYDFGFSKTLDDTWAHWPSDSVLKDVVRIVRRFRPQVIVSVFSGTPRDGHGQHQAAGWAAQEAFRVAGDPTRFPELATEEGLQPFTPTKLYIDAWFNPNAATLTLDGGEVEKLSGKTYHQLAMAARSLHRSQDMGNLQEFGPSPSRLMFKAVRGGTADVGEGWAGFWSGVDTVLKAPPEHFAALAEARAAAGRDPVAVAQALERARASFGRTWDPTDRSQWEYVARIDAATRVVRWLFADFVAERSTVAPGDLVNVRLIIRNAGGRVVPRFRSVILAGGSSGPRPDSLAPGQAVDRVIPVRVQDSVTATTPYYLQSPRAGDLYRWPAGPFAIRSDPFEPFPLRGLLESVADDSTRLTRATLAESPVSSRVRDQAFGEVRRPVVIVPRVSVYVDPSVSVVRSSRASGTTSVKFDVRLEHGATDTTTGEYFIRTPAGWPRATPIRFRLAGQGATASGSFYLSVPQGLPAGQLEFAAVAVDGSGREYTVGAFTVDYPHIRPRQYIKPAIARVEVIDLTPPPVRRVAYIRGAADKIPEALSAAGLNVTILDSAQIAAADLSGFDAVVVGPRAYEVDSSLVRNNARLIDYARNGGRVVVQYQQQVYLEGSFAPYALGGNSRITDERSPVTMLGATPSQSALAPVFRTPNAIGQDDWDGWVQDRALYCPTTWGPEFHPLLVMNDPGEAPIRGCLLEAQVGRGSYVYTGIAFFRELPAGVPGAYRLFFNLLGGRATP